MASEFYIPLRSDVGIQRDGTPFDTTLHLNGSMTRFYRGRPQKIGGWQLIQTGTSEIIRTLYSYDSDGFIYLYLGRPSSLSYIQVFADLSTSSSIDRTPAAGFVANIDNNWVLDSVTYQDIVYVVASVSPDLIDIGDTDEQPVFYGTLDGTTPFLPMTDGISGPNITTSGGIMCISEFIVLYGEGGIVRWNTGEDFTTWPVENFFQLGTSKFIYGAPVRSASSPSALIWSLGGTGLMTVNDTGTGFDASFISTRSTILSSNCVISFDPCFYWIGTDSFWMWNGAVQELPNNVNKKWFFDNINQNEKGKTFGYVNTQWSEVWWIFCLGDATEPNHALIFNTQSLQWQNQAWFDTDQFNRSAAIPSGSVIPYPIMTSSVPVQNGGDSFYPIYVHEIGVDQVEFGVTTPIVASIQSAYTNLWASNQYSVNAKVAEIDSVIIDIVQSGSMYFYINYLGYPNSTVRQTDNFYFTDTTEFLTVRVRGSIFSITFVSNVMGGNFVMGNTMLRMIATDDQRPGPTS